MYKFLIAGALTALATFSTAQTTVSTGATDNALGPSIAVFTSAEMTPRTIIRIAYIDGSSSNMYSSTTPGTAIVVKDYTSAMSYLGQVSVTISGTSPCYGQPRLSRDGRGVAFIGEDDAIFISHPYFATLSANPYTSSTSVGATAAPYAGISGSTLGASNVLIFGGLGGAPAISNIDDGGFIIVWPDLRHDDDEWVDGPGHTQILIPGYNPLMVWDTNGGTVADVPGTNNATYPAINSDATYVAFCMAGQIYRGYSTSLAWGTGTVDTVSQYSSTLGNDVSDQTAIDGSGAYVVFASDATNLRASDTNAMRDIYVWNSGTLTLPYTDPGSSGGSDCDRPSISPDADWIGFSSTNQNFLSSTVDYGFTSGVYNVYRVQRGTPGSLTLMSRTTGTPIPAVTGDYADVANSGHFVFHTGATGIASGDTRTGADIIYRPN